MVSRGNDEKGVEILSVLRPLLKLGGILLIHVSMASWLNGVQGSERHATLHYAACSLGCRDR